VGLLTAVDDVTDQCLTDPVRSPVTVGEPVPRQDRIIRPRLRSPGQHYRGGSSRIEIVFDPLRPTRARPALPGWHVAVQALGPFAIEAPFLAVGTRTRLGSGTEPHGRLATRGSVPDTAGTDPLLVLSLARAV
jgi:hypothetical protein